MSMGSDLMPLPEQFPTAAIWELCAEALRDRSLPDWEEAAHCLLHVLAWGLNQVHDHPDGFGAGRAAMSRAEAASVCDTLALQAAEGRAAGEARQAGWLSALLPALLPVLIEVIGRLPRPK